MFRKHVIRSAVWGGVLVLALAGCSAPAAEPEEEPSESGSSEPMTSPDEMTGDGTTLMVAESSLGEIVVDGEGMTVYMFDQDTQGAGVSTCEGQCAENWPAVTVEGDLPEAEGVTGEVGTIEGVDGETQVTLNGWPLYYFAGDAAAGDVNGQGVNDVWWVLSPAGERMAE